MQIPIENKAQILRTVHSESSPSPLFDGDQEPTKTARPLYYEIDTGHDIKEISASTFNFKHRAFEADFHSSPE